MQSEDMIRNPVQNAAKNHLTIDEFQDSTEAGQFALHLWMHRKEQKTSHITLIHTL